MIALVVFLVVGAAAAALLRPSLPPSIPGFLGALFLIGIACNGIALYVAGVVRLPQVPHVERIILMQRVLALHTADLQQRAILTVRGRRIRVTRYP